MTDDFGYLLRLADSNAGRSSGIGFFGLLPVTAFGQPKLTCP
jgi:hypothetical protein